MTEFESSGWMEPEMHPPVWVSYEALQISLEATVLQALDALKIPLDRDLDEEDATDECNFDDEQTASSDLDNLNPSPDLNLSGAFAAAESRQPVELHSLARNASDEFTARAIQSKCLAGCTHHVDACRFHPCMHAHGRMLSTTHWAGAC